MNRMSFVLAFFMLVFVVNSIVLKSYLILPFALFFCVNFLLVPVFLHQKRIELAKWFFALTPIIEVSVIAVLNGSSGGDKFYLLTTGIIPVTVFRNKWIGFMFFELSLICLLVVSYLQTIFQPMVYIEPKILLIYEYVNYITIAFILYLFTRYFKNDSERIENELILQKEIIEEKHKEITDSINYAERLQKSLMASKKMLDQHLKHYYIYFNPKEKVSGDFYWCSVLPNNKVLIACADSTGHGVPGAIMSMMNMNSLKESVKEGLEQPNDVLNHTRSIIIETLANDGTTEGGKDGMDCALLCFDFKHNKLQFALANNPLWLIRNGELMEYLPDKMPVGRHDKQEQPFTNHEIELIKGDWIIALTDGYPDQFGGNNALQQKAGGKKFKYSNLKKLILACSQDSPELIKEKLHVVFEQWRGEMEQTDDVCIIGVKI